MKEELESLVYTHRWVALGGLAGLILLGVGIFLARSGVFEGTKVEVIDPSASSGQGSEVVVEIAGAVIKPGVYQLGSDGRVEQLLIASGGLSAEADREWVEKNLNRAARLLDGQKIYIPGVGETPLRQGSAGQGGVVGGTSTGLININTATAAELDTLWGIGSARASAIIDGRPFSSVEELLARKIIPPNVYERIKDEVTAP